jgi:hypothetical protein
VPAEFRGDCLIATQLHDKYRIVQSQENLLDTCKVIVEAAFDPRHPSELCLAMADLLAAILASEAGNLALKVLAMGGGYLASGIALYLVQLLQKPQSVQTLTRRPLERFNGTDADSHHHNMQLFSELPHADCRALSKQTKSEEAASLAPLEFA